MGWGPEVSGGQGMNAEEKRMKEMDAASALEAMRPSVGELCWEGFLFLAAFGLVGFLLAFHAGGGEAIGGEAIVVIMCAMAFMGGAAGGRFVTLLRFRRKIMKWLRQRQGE